MATPDSYEAIFNDSIAIIERDDEALPEAVRIALARALRNSCADIKTEYERLRDDTKNKFMEDVNGPLDRHKCAACFMIALMTKLDIEHIDQNPLTPKMTKEKIAIDVGRSILVTMIRKDGEKNAELIAFLNENDNELIFPDTLCDEEPYSRNWALCLYYSRKDNCLHVLPLSNTLFLIETYNWERARKEQPSPQSTDRFHPYH